MTKITIFGGDQRLRTACAALTEKGFSVDSLGLFDDDCADCASSDVFLLPVPATRDGRTVSTPLTNKIIPLSYIEQTAGDRLVLTGVYKPQVRHCLDYCASDSYALKNAVPTAEGAIQTAIERTDFTLSGSRVLVIGFGRTGKVLCDRLMGLHCRVTAAARRGRDRALIEALGADALPTDALSGRAADFDIIFNTADAPLLDGCRTGALVIDLSTAGCMSEESASARGINYCRAPGLPGKTAPHTAGLILAETVCELIAEHQQTLGQEHPTAKGEAL